MSAVYTVGDGKTYATIPAALAAIPSDLTGQGHQHVQVYEKAAGYTGFIHANIFSNGSAADYVDIEAMVSHEGTRDQGIVLDVGTVAEANHIELGAFMRFHGFCVKATSHKPSATLIVVRMSGEGVRVYDNIIYDCDADVGRVVYGVSKQGINQLIYNNQIIGLGRGYSGSGGGTGRGYWHLIDNSSAPNDLIANNTILDCSGDGFYAGSAQNYLDLYNNYAGGNGLDDFELPLGVGTNFDFNISSDATAGVADGNLSSKAAVDQFVSVTQGAEDLHLLETADCNRVGEDLSAFFTTDNEGHDRVDWNTGADEYVPPVVVRGARGRVRVRPENLARGRIIE